MMNEPSFGSLFKIPSLLPEFKFSQINSAERGLPFWSVTFPLIVITLDGFNSFGKVTE